MRWKKLGLLFSTDNQHPWMISHASNPVAFPLDEANGIVRIFFSCRDAHQKSSISYVDVNFRDKFKVIAIAQMPVLSKGSPGYFDDDGVSMSWIIPIENKYYLYYLGWNLRLSVPWLNTIGLAVADGINGPFRKFSNAPVMDRHHVDPFTVSYPCVLFDQNKFRMWYGSNLTWGKEQHEMAHVIKYAESKDGITWERSSDVHIPLEHPGEYAISKPCVVKDQEGYKMFYSYRASEYSDKYRIGFAESNDGLSWKRKDSEIGISVSDSGWDSESIEYPNAFTFDGNTYLLYNGNQYGKTGFGLAVLEAEAEKI